MLNEHIDIDIEDRSWQDRANCLGVDPDLFFPSGERRPRGERGVPRVRGSVECLEYALVNGEKFGIWGGLEERQRRRIRRQRALTVRKVVSA